MSSESTIESGDENQQQEGLPLPEHRRLQKMVRVFELKFNAANGISINDFVKQYLEDEDNDGLIYQLLPHAVQEVKSWSSQGHSFPSIQFRGFPPGAGPLGNGSTIPF